MSSAPLTLKFSTADFGTERVEAWRHLFGRSVCELDIEPLPGQNFRSKALVHVLPGLGVASGVSSGARYWRPSHLIMSDDLVFVINHAGADNAQMLGRESVISPGHAVLFAADNVGGTTNKGYSRFTTIRVPRASVAPALGDLHAAILKPVRPDNYAMRLLNNYLSILEDADSFTDPRTCALVVSHVHDLIALALGSHRDDGVTTRNAVAAARLRAIKAEVAQSATNLSLNISSIAARHGVTPRYVQILFEDDGTTFSEYVLMNRLAAAHRMLGDRNGAAIGEIAGDCGFGDISYFNRIFRRHFGATPSDVRARAPDFRLPVH